MTVSVPAAANSGSDLRRSHGRLIGVVALLGTAAALGPIPALAAEGVSRGGSQALFIAQIALLLLVGRLMGEVAQRIGQPSVMGQLIAGLLLGPSATRPVPTSPPTRRFCAKQAAAMILSFLASAGGPAICYSSGTLRRLSSNGRRHRFSSSRVSIAKAQIRNGPVRNGPNVDNSFACTIGL